MQQQSIAIIGGGYTGLVAAYRLLKLGYRVTIFEKGNAVGGLASDFKIAGENLEKAYHHLFHTDKDILNLVTELGLDSKLEWRPSSVSIYYEGKLYPFMTPIDLLLFSPLNLIDRIRAGVVALYLQKTKNWKQFTQVPAYVWMQKWAGNGVTKVIWEPLLKGKFAKFYDKVAMAWLWARIHTRGNSKAPGDTKEMLGYFNGGFNVVTEALLQQITDLGGKLVLQADVSGIQIGDNPQVLVNGETLRFDRILSTIPSHIFAKLIQHNPGVTPEYISQLNSVDYLGAVVAIFTSSQDLSKFYWHNINDVEAPFLVFINHTKFVPAERYGGKNVYYIGTYIPHDHEYFGLTEEQIYTKWFDYLRQVFPEFVENLVEQKHLFKFKYAQHIVDTGYEAKLPDYRTPLPNVYLANFSQIYPEDRGTNFAVREGNKLAQMIDKDIQSPGL